MRNSSSASLFAFWILILVIIVPSPGSATTYVLVADDTLADQADVIVEVRVLEVDPSPSIGRPVTDYRMAVDRVIRGGAVASPLTVRTPGGILANGIGLHVYGAPSFEEGQRALLFLTPHANGTYRILHLMLGAFRLVERDGESLALRQLSGAEEISLPGRVPPRDGPRNLERFRVWLEDRSRGVTRSADYFVELLPEKFTILTSSGRKIRWRTFDSGGNVSFRAHAGGQPGLSGGGFSQFQTALAAWRNDPDTPIDYRYAGTTSSIGGALNTYDGVNQILFDDLATPSAFDQPFSCGAGESVVAVGGVWFSGTHTFNGETFNTAIGGDIVTNKGIDCLSGGQPWIAQKRRAEETFAHELGHTLGLGHSCGDSTSPSCGSSATLNDALLRAYLHGDNRGARLKSDDRAGIRFLYNPINPPAAPSGLTATAVSSTQIDLAWNDNSTDEEDFDLERRTGGGSFARIARPVANSNSYQDTGLLSSTTYCYRIRAVNDGGTSSFSNTACATLDGTPPGDPLSQVAGLIVPGFEVQVDSPSGPTTFFAVRNTSDQPTTTSFSFYSRFGPLDEPLRTDVYTLGPQETKTVNVASDLTGLEVTDGSATGLILIAEDGNPSAPNLEGDFFRLDADNAFATGDRLVRPTDLCLNQEIRFVDFGSGSQFRILLDQPRGPNLPSFTYHAYMENGDLIVQDELFTSDHLTTIDVVDLGIAPAFGTVIFDFSNSGGGFVSAKYSAFGLFSVELSSACRD